MYDTDLAATIVEPVSRRRVGWRVEKMTYISEYQPKAVAWTTIRVVVSSAYGGFRSVLIAHVTKTLIK